MFIKNSQGNKSISLTMVAISFAVTTLWLLFWLIGSAFGLTIPAFDVTVAMGYFTPIATLYFGRRWSEQKNNNNSNTNSSTVKSSSSNSSQSEEDEMNGS